MDNFFNNVCEEIKVVLCTTPSLLEKAKNIRHEVFCIENGYEKINLNKIEEDKFDTLSHHLLAVHRRTGDAIATMRLIVSPVLPLHAYIPDNHILKNTMLAEGKTAEFSRLAVRKNHRGSFVAKASAALFFAAGYLAVKLGFTTVGGVMKKSLIRVLSRVGVACTKVTENFEHRGERAVYVMTCYDFIGQWSKYTSFDSAKFDGYFYKLVDFSVIINNAFIACSLTKSEAP